MDPYEEADAQVCIPTRFKQFVKINSAYVEALKMNLVMIFVGFQNKSSGQVCLWACVRQGEILCSAVKNVLL